MAPSPPQQAERPPEVGDEEREPGARAPLEVDRRQLLAVGDAHGHLEPLRRLLLAEGGVPSLGRRPAQIAFAEVAELLYLRCALCGLVLRLPQLAAEQREEQSSRRVPPRTPLSSGDSS